MSKSIPMVKWYPRLFTEEMVLALLSDRKTATRWPLRKQPVGDVAKRAGEWVWEDAEGKVFRAPVCPGDIIWGRETWSQEDAVCPPVYRADGTDLLGNKWQVAALENVRWHPNIHMPRECARVLLRVNDINLVRVQNMSEAEAESEGIVPEFEMDAADFIKGKRTQITYYLGFKHIWQRLYDGGPYAWKANPHVWAASFRRISKAEAEA